MRKLLIILSLLLCLRYTVRAASTYYVDNTNGACSAGGGGTSLVPFCTIASATAVATSAGDRVNVVAGSYNETLSPGGNGSAGLPIVFDGNSQAAIIKKVNLFPSSVARSYITIQNFTITSNGVGFTADTNPAIIYTGSSHAVITGNSIHDVTTNNSAVRAVTTVATDAYVASNSMYNISAALPAGYDGASNHMNVANETYCNRCTFENNEIYYSSDQIRPRGDRIVVRNNTFHDNYAWQDPASHIDGLQADCQAATDAGITKLLFEGNQVSNNTGPQTHFGLNNATAPCGGISNVLVRYNVTNNIGEGTWLSNSTTGGSASYGFNHKLYNNTFVRSGPVLTGSVATIGGGNASGSVCTSANISATPVAGGTGYSNATVYPTSGAGGTGLTVKVFTSGGVVSKAVVVSYGSGYTVSTYDTMTMLGVNAPITIVGGDSGAIIYSCSREDTAIAVSLTAIQNSSYYNNIMYDSITGNGSTPTGYSFGSGRIATGHVSTTGTGYVTLNNSIIQAASSCASASLDVVNNGSGGVSAASALRAPGLSCSLSTPILFICKSTSSSCTGSPPDGRYTIDSLITETNTGGNNIGYQSAYPSLAWGSPMTGSGNITGVSADPLFVNSVSDFHITTTSPAKNAGTYLTTTVGAGVASTALTLADANFFQDGWGPTGNTVNPDCIAVGTVSNTACIVANSVNYSTGVLTLDAPLTWSNGDHVWLYKKSDGVIILSGTAPDIGAYEFSSAPPTPGGGLAASFVTSSTLTLSWTKATDDSTPQNQLTYEVCQSLSNNVTSVAQCEAATIIQSFTTDIATVPVTGLTPSTTYYFNVVVKDGDGNKAAYTPTSAGTTVVVPPPRGVTRFRLRH